jgi:threonine dehydratase
VWPVTFRDILDAEHRVRPLIPPTALRGYPALDEIAGATVLVKHENHNPTNSFKARNGVSLITSLTDAQRRRGVVAATRGNHGQGLAWAGRELGVAVTVCVPVGNNPEKNEAMRGYGATLIERGRDYDEAVAIARELVERDGLHMAHSTNDPAVIAGAGTFALEVLRDQAPELDAMVIAVGGGSQAVGAMTVARELCPALEVYAVQAERAAAIHDSWHAKQPLTRDSADTIADGLATRSTYPLTFGALCEGLADFVTVSEEAIVDAMRVVLRTTHQLVEPAGAAGLAGLLALRDRLAGKRVGIVLSGGNVDRDTLRRAVCSTMDGA